MIYFDHAATTASLPEAAQAAMKDHDRGLRQSVVPVSAGGVQAAKRMGEHREQVARALGCQGEEVYFYLGGNRRGDNSSRCPGGPSAATRAGTSSPRRSSTPRCFSPARSWSARDMRSPTPPRRLRPGSGGGPGGRSGRTHRAGVHDAGEQ